FGILMGTDFDPDGFKGIGPVRGLKLLKTYHSIDKIEPLQEEVGKIDYQAIRDLFLPPPARKGIHPSWGELRPDALRAYLVDEHSFSAERVDSAIKRIVNVERSKTEIGRAACRES